MKVFRKAAAAALAAVMTAAVLVGCNEQPATSSAPDSSKVFNVGICQYADHAALNKASEGFKKALSDKLGNRITFTETNAAADTNACITACGAFVEKNADLIFANGTIPLQAAYAVTAETPIVAASVTDIAVALGFERDITATGLNVTGVTDMVPLKDQADMLHELFPDEKKVGVLYCSEDLGSTVQAQGIVPVLTDLGYEVKEYAFKNADELEAKTKAACKSSDVIYIPADNAAALNASVIDKIASDKKVPIVTAEEGLCADCGAVTLTPDYSEMGYAAGEMAYDILLLGSDPGTMKFKTPDKVVKKYVPERCEKLGVSVPDSYVKIE